MPPCRVTRCPQQLMLKPPSVRGELGFAARRCVAPVTRPIDLAIPAGAAGHRARRRCRRAGQVASSMTVVVVTMSFVAGVVARGMSRIIEGDHPVAFVDVDASPEAGWC